MAISIPFTGGCACGAIRYECSAQPLLVWKCHCRVCQQATGSAFYLNVLVPEAAFRLTQGEPQVYAVTAESGTRIRRDFCTHCGSLVGSKREGTERRGVSGASLDDPSGLEPQAEIWTASAQPWDVLNSALPHFPHQPTMADMQELLTVPS